MIVLLKKCFKCKCSLDEKKEKGGLPRGESFKLSEFRRVPETFYFISLLSVKLADSDETKQVSDDPVWGCRVFRAS